MILYLFNKERETLECKTTWKFPILAWSEENSKRRKLIPLLAFDPTQRCLHIVSAP
jgi:hypothetical protein